MKAFQCIIALTLLLVLSASPAFSSSCNTGQKKGHHGYSGHFGDMDLDGNDEVSWEEFKKHFPKTDKNTFKGVDKNKDGAIDHDEWHDFKEHHGYGHKHTSHRRAIVT